MVPATPVPAAAMVSVPFTVPPAPVRVGLPVAVLPPTVTALPAAMEPVRWRVPALTVVARV